MNNYPLEFINKHINNRLNEIRNKQNGNDNNNISIDLENRNKNKIDFRKTIKIPYTEKFSNNISRLLRKFDINIVHNIPYKLNKYIKKGKDNLKNMNQKGVVYQINCNDCAKNYVGQTGRLLSTRVNEHRNNINHNKKYHSVITNHKINSKKDNEKMHEFNWEKAKILHRDNNTKNREFVEMLYIKNDKNSINKKTDLETFHPSYEIILKKLI